MKHMLVLLVCSKELVLTTYRTSPHRQIASAMYPLNALSITRYTSYDTTVIITCVKILRTPGGQFLFKSRSHVPQKGSTIHDIVSTYARQTLYWSQQARCGEHPSCSVEHEHPDKLVVNMPVFPQPSPDTPTVPHRGDEHPTNAPHIDQENHLRSHDQREQQLGAVPQQVGEPGRPSLDLN